MLIRIVKSINKNFQPNNKPRLLRKSALSVIKGIAASKVPAGQMNLQKAGIPTPSQAKNASGIMIIKSIPMGYLRYVSFNVSVFL
jgi:hypothetical protein